MVVGQKTIETKHDVVGVPYGFMAATIVLPMDSICSVKGSFRPVAITSIAISRVYVCAAGEHKVIIRSVSFLDKMENEEVTNRKVGADVTMRVVQDRPLSRLSYVAALYEALVRLLRCCPSKLLFVGEQICLVVFVSSVGVVPAPS